MYYIAAGNVMLDTVRLADGSNSKKEHIGGPATFAYTGIKLWTDNVIQCSKVGADYKEIFEPWFKKNNIDSKGIKIVCDHSNHSYLVYNSNGTYESDSNIERFRSDWVQDFGYMKTTPEEIGELTKHKDVKGVYLAQNVDYTFWEKLNAIKERDNFKIMWEIEAPSAYKKYLSAVINAIRKVDVFSINVQEAQTLFDVQTEQECIIELQKMPVKITIFRVGKKGLYTITKEHVYFHATVFVNNEVDPTGSGNTSTGSALYAYCEGYDQFMIGTMANVASSFNVQQFGVIPEFAKIREKAMELAKQIYKEKK